MVATQGSRSRVQWSSDFTGVYTDMVWGTGQLAAPFDGGLGFTSVNEGSFASIRTLPDGVLAITTDTGDDDNAFLVGCPMKPSLGEGWMEARFRTNSATLGAIYMGYTSVLAIDTPVMPAEFATVTMTYNASATTAGMIIDTDGTVIDARAAFANAGTVLSTADANGTRANDSLVANEWMVCRVEVKPDGRARVLFGHATDQLKLVKEVTNLPTGTILFPCLGFENRSAAARIFSIDYFFGGSDRDWTN